MATENNRRDFRRQVFFSVAGIAVGLLVAGLIALLINNVIEPTMQVETHDLVEFHGDTFSIWYHVDSPYMNSRQELRQQLQRTLDDLLDRLHVSLEDIPLPIDVLVHDTPQMMQQTTLRRKSVGAMYSFYSVIDLVYGEDPLPRLAELVLAFGWGNCNSQLLYVGMLSNVIEPDRNFDIPIAAAPRRLLYSLDDLIQLEASGEFQETLYQRYQSPFSPRMAAGSFESMSEFRSMLTNLDDEATEYDIADLEAASLVQYLIDCSGGLESFRAVWGPGTTRALLERLACAPSDELFDVWLASVQSSDTSGDEFEYYRARFLFEGGDLEAAATITDTWKQSGISSARSVLGFRTQLAVGDIATAARFAAGADSATSMTLEQWLEGYEGWRMTQEGAFSVMTSGTDAEVRAILSRVKAAYEDVVSELQFDRDELPPHVTVFYYRDDVAREEGEASMPMEDTQRTLWHISAQDDLAGAFAGTLPSYVTKKTTASNLLRTGLVAALTIERSELNRRGCQILLAGEWTPLWRVGFGGLPRSVFEVQTGLMIQYVLDTYGPTVIPDLWFATARIGGGQSLDTAFKSVLETSRTKIEEELVESVLVCE